jgi:hypothetical protein
MKKRLFLVLFTAALFFQARAVTLSITPGPTFNPVCPLTAIPYSVGAPSGGSCAIYHWSVTGGIINSGQSTQNVSVTWTDQTGNGTLSVTATSCSPSSLNGSSGTATYVKLSAFGLSFPSGVCNPTITIPLCSTGPANICVNHLYIAGAPSREVDRYIFTIPAGWRSGGTNGPANITTTSNSIPIEPLPGTNSGGVVTVVGSVSNSCGGTANSNPTTINLVRQAVTIAPPVGYTGAGCGNTAPVTFTATSLTCATSYAWTIPSGWSGSSSSNSITLTPNGANGGTVSVVVTLSTGGTVTATPYTVPYTNVVPAPTLTGGPTWEFCNYETFTLTATAPNGYATNFGFDWYGLPTVTINSTSPTSAAPLHTTTNTVTVAIPGSNFGPQAIAVRMNNQVCNPSNYTSMNKRVGPYSNSEFTIIGPSVVCPNTAADFRPNFITSDLTGYQWSAPAGWSNTGQGTPYFSVSVPSPFPGGAITLRLQNRCGWTNTPYVLNLSAGSCFAFAYSPNPATETLSVSELDPNKEATAVLVDRNNVTRKTQKSKDGKIEMDLSQVPNGLYILIVKQNGTAESQQVVVNH